VRIYDAKKPEEREMNINRLVSLAATVAFLGCMAAAGPVSAQTKEARGTVTAVTTTTKTVNVGTQDMKILVDSNTRLEVRRAAKEVQSQQPGNPKPRVNDFFEVGNPVLVRYRSDNAGNHALDIERVGSPGSAEPTNPTKLAEGKVTSVTATHVTVAANGRDMTFAVTGETDVLVKGATKATKAAGGTTQLTTFVHSGDMVSVSYKEAAGTMTASEIRVRVSSK
jgi:preprotein translocase subunit YajC